MASTSAFMSTVLDALERNLEVDSESEAIAYILYRFVFQADTAKLDQCRSLWKYNHMFRGNVQWLSFFAAARLNHGPAYCTRWNHPNGKGCNDEKCKNQHRCYLCNKKDHGVFFDDDGGWICDLHAVLCGDIAELKLEWGDFFSVAEELRDFHLNNPTLEKDEFIAHVRQCLKTE